MLMLDAKAFSSTTVSVEKSMGEIDRLLTKHGIRENRFTHVRPPEPGARGDLGDGVIVYEFAMPEGPSQARRGVRIVVRYHENVGARGGRSGVSAEMAGRALYWHLKNKFDSIAFGIESFDVAFMPYLRTELPDGGTLAEHPELIEQFTAQPLAIRSFLALSPPREEAS